MLKIIDPSQPLIVRPPRVVIYSAPGLGKTTLACTARDPLLLDFDDGAIRSGVRARGTVQVETWADMLELAKGDELNPYKTVVVDTVGRALDFLSRAVISAEPKHGNKYGGLTLSGYGAMKSQFAHWVQNLQDRDIALVMIAHSTEDRDGDESVERLDIAGGSKNLVYQTSDVMGALVITNRKREWVTEPSSKRFGKDPTGVGRRTIPAIPPATETLAKWMDELKGHFEQEAQQREQKAKDASGMLLAAEECQNIQEMTDLVIANRSASYEAKKAIQDVAEKRGWSWSKEENRFVAEPFGGVGPSGGDLNATQAAIRAGYSAARGANDE